MKKNVLLLSIVALGFTSCSKSDAPAAPAIPLVDPNGILLRRTINTVVGDTPLTSLITYNGNKILKITNSEGYTNYTYTGDLVTKVEVFDIANVLQSSETYSYDSSNKLNTYISKDVIGNSASKEVYTHNTDGTISVVNSHGNLTTQTILDFPSKIFFLNGEVNKIETYLLGGAISLRTYSYDTKNHPFKNVLGFNKISFVNDFAEGIAHNIISITYDSGTVNNQFTCNTLDFPTIEKDFDSTNTLSETIEYFYE